MKSEEWRTGFRPFNRAACTLMSKSSLCVAMGTRATLTKGEQRETQKRQGKEKKQNSMKRREKLVRFQETKEEKKNSIDRIY